MSPYGWAGIRLREGELDVRHLQILDVPQK